MSGTGSSSVMGMYRKKPVVIEARQYGDPVQGFDSMELAEWAGAEFDGFDQIIIPTLEGRMVAHPGDWIIKGVKGEFYPCKPDIFETTYEAVE